MKTLVVLTLALLFACSSSPIPAYLKFSHSYKNVVGADIDSSDLEFDIFIGDSLEFREYAVISDTSLYLIDDQSLYTDSTHYFYVRAWQISTARASEPSDTTSDFFQIIPPDKPFEVKTINLGD